MIATALGMALFGWSYAVACTSVYGTARAAWLRRRKSASGSTGANGARGPDAPHRANTPPRAGTRVLLIRPCAGSEPGLEYALGSLSGARSEAEIACRFAIESVGDPAAEAAARATDALRAWGLDARIVLTRADAPNHKAAQIEAVVAQEAGRFDFLVVADSDVDLAAFDLDRLLAPMIEDASVGAVWAPPVEVGAASGLGDRASAGLLSGSLHAFTILGALDGGALVGKLFAARPAALRAANALEPMKRVLGEDMELARRLRAAGFAVRVAPVVARSLKSGRSWQEAVDRYARWLTVIRAQRPRLLASYPLLFLAAPLVLGLSALLAPFAPHLALASAAVALATRVGTALAARRLAGLSLRKAASSTPSLAPLPPRSAASLGTALIDALAGAVLADALLAHAFGRALASRTLTWRGRTLTIDRRGSLVEAPPRAAGAPGRGPDRSPRPAAETAA